ncbi:MAG: phosphate signaling complex protein PhoU [Anaerolineales bacterium]
MRTTFEAEIQQLKDELLVMGSMVEEQILASVEALKKRDRETSQHIFEADVKINSKRYGIEEQVMVLIATQQPMAHDLRLLASILEVSAELERMGDYAKGIATINLRMVEDGRLKLLSGIPQMAQKDSDMLHRALTAFINEDVETARAIPTEDDVVDALYTQVYRELMKLVIADPTIVEQSNFILWTAHNLERFADRVTNICERTVFIATGEVKEIGSSGDGSA